MPMAIDRRLLEILCCPVSKRPLRLLRSDQQRWLNDAIASLKGSLVRARGQHAEIYDSAGQGFHSIDTRGTTSRLDPASGEAVDPVDPLVRSLGAEIGARLCEAGE